ncbi:hypothetical protein FEF65_10970 [Mariprofundus erugo]|uniref:Uncharacterized protein n=1 Tax=Mariprofundus erugo TaxID=2528639 RepID=A0A5R9GPK3_9PROT|nr:hypothetical protein [Mariprofundus erugo]TLS66323.1 hypothetical protein FEF65_10970 [Mariprofundus erugo]
MNDVHDNTTTLGDTRISWGEKSPDHHGYASEQERLEKRGLEDWEMVENIHEARLRIPKWFIAIIVAIVITAFGLSLPFWGDRPGMERPWLTMGHLYALGYMLVFGGIIYFMTTLYGSGSSGRPDRDVIDDDIDMPKRKYAR